MQSQSPNEIIERGAETLRMPDGSGFAIAIADYPDEGIRRVFLMRVESNDTDRTIHEYSEPLA